MRSKSRFLTATAAARQLGVSAKALRLYERHGLIAPSRTRSGWRTYGAADMKRAADIVQLRKLGLGLADIGDVLRADGPGRETLLAAHKVRLEQQKRHLDATLCAIDRARSEQNETMAAAPLPEASATAVTFDLPWPWGGERFALALPKSLTFITGPLGSGKTRFAMRLADALPGGCFLGLGRLSGKPLMARPQGDREGLARCEHIARHLAVAGAAPSHALTVLVENIYAGSSGPLVIDMVEQELDHATQEALIATLRQDPPVAPLFLMTRSSAILDLSKAESGETIIYCPANHSPPMIVRADPSCPGHEAVATCLAAPAVRARSAAVIAAWMPIPHTPTNDSRETIC